MRTTIDIPDPIYREVKLCAAGESRTVREIVLEAITLRLSKREAPSKVFKLPLIHSTRTDKVEIDNEKIYEIIDIF